MRRKDEVFVLRRLEEAVHQCGLMISDIVTRGMGRNRVEALVQ